MSTYPNKHEPFFPDFFTVIKPDLHHEEINLITYRCTVRFKRKGVWYDVVHYREYICNSYEGVVNSRKLFTENCMRTKYLFKVDGATVSDGFLSRKPIKPSPIQISEKERFMNKWSQDPTLQPMIDNLKKKK